MKKILIRLIDILNYDKDIIFIDESEFNNNIINNYGYDIRGTGTIKIPSN